MKKFLKNFKLSLLVFRSEKRHLILHGVIFFLTVFLSLSVGSMSSGLDQLVNSDESRPEDREIWIRGQAEEIDSEVVELYRETKGARLVKMTRIKNMAVDNHVRLEMPSGDYFVGYIRFIDQAYETFGLFDQGSIPDFAPGEEAQFIIDSALNETWPQDGELRIKTADETLLTHKVSVIGSTAESASSYTLASLDLLEFFRSAQSEELQTETEYTFSFPHISDAVKFYDRLLKEEPQLVERIVYNGTTLYNYFQNMKIAGNIINIVLVVVLIFLIANFINMLTIFFIDKRRNIGLFKAQGLSSSRSVFIMSAPIWLVTAAASLAAVLATYLLMPFISQLLSTLFVGQFISDVKFGVDLTTAIVVPLAATICTAAPCSLFVLKSARKQAVELMR